MMDAREYYKQRMIQAESGGNPDAVSPKGALTRYQVMPSTAKSPGLGITPARDMSREEIERVGSEYWDKLWERYGGDPVLTAAAYNAGYGAVDKYGGVPPYSETQDYTRKVAGTRPISAQTVSTDSGGPSLTKIPVEDFYKSEEPQQARKPFSAGVLEPSEEYSSENGVTSHSDLPRLHKIDIDEFNAPSTKQITGVNQDQPVIPEKADKDEREWLKFAAYHGLHGITSAADFIGSLAELPKTAAMNLIEGQPVMEGWYGNEFTRALEAAEKMAGIEKERYKPHGFTEQAIASGANIVGGMMVPFPGAAGTGVLSAAKAGLPGTAATQAGKNIAMAGAQGIAGTVAENLMSPEFRRDHPYLAATLQASAMMAVPGALKVGQVMMVDRAKSSAQKIAKDYATGGGGALDEAFQAVLPEGVTPTQFAQALDQFTDQLGPNGMKMTTFEAVVHPDFKAVMSGVAGRPVSDYEWKAFVQRGWASMQLAGYKGANVAAHKRMGEIEKSRNEAMQRLAPEGADIIDDDIADSFRDQLIDATAVNTRKLEDRAANLIDRMGGEMQSKEQIGSSMRTALDEAESAAHKAAQAAYPKLSEDVLPVTYQMNPRTMAPVAVRETKPMLTENISRKYDEIMEKLVGHDPGRKGIEKLSPQGRSIMDELYRMKTEGKANEKSISQLRADVSDWASNRDIPPNEKRNLAGIKDALDADIVTPYDPAYAQLFEEATRKFKEFGQTYEGKMAENILGKSGYLYNLYDQDIMNAVLKNPQTLREYGAMVPGSEALISNAFAYRLKESGVYADGKINPEKWDKWIKNSTNAELISSAPPIVRQQISDIANASAEVGAQRARLTTPAVKALLNEGQDIGEIAVKQMLRKGLKQDDIIALERASGLPPKEFRANMKRVILSRVATNFRSQNRMTKDELIKAVRVSRTGLRELFGKEDKAFHDLAKVQAAISKVEDLKSVRQPGSPTATNLADMQALQKTMAGKIAEKVGGPTGAMLGGVIGSWIGGWQVGSMMAGVGAAAGSAISRRIASQDRLMELAAQAVTEAFTDPQFMSALARSGGQSVMRKILDTKWQDVLKGAGLTAEEIKNIAGATRAPFETDLLRQ